MGLKIEINQLKIQGKALSGRECITAVSSSSNWETKSYQRRDNLCGDWRGVSHWRGVSGDLRLLSVWRGGASLRRRSIEGKLYLSMPSVCQMFWERFNTPLLSADKDMNIWFLAHKFRYDKYSVWQVLIYQCDTTGLWWQSQEKIVIIGCQEITEACSGTPVHPGKMISSPWGVKGWVKIVSPLVLWKHKVIFATGS